MHPNLRIILVDDNLRFLTAAHDFINFHESIEVVASATNGQDALAKIRQLHPDIVLIDLNLGAESGLDLINQIKQELPGTKIIILTIMDEAMYQGAALRAGADAFVRKTDMGNSLIDKIRRLGLISLSEQGKKAL